MMNNNEPRKRNSGNRKKPAKPKNKQRGSGGVELLVATATLAATVVAVWPWISSPKLPPTAGD